MHHLIIDTTDWVELCKKLPDLLDKIVDLVERGRIRLIIPSIVVDEWTRQKPKIYKEREDSIRSIIKHARTMEGYLDPDKAHILKNMADEVQADTSRIERLAGERIQAIDQLFNYPSTAIVEISDGVKLDAVALALEKKAPFGRKNSMADALILLSVVEYIADNGISDCIFVSSNTQDFGAPSNASEIHEDLRELLAKHNLIYEPNIGKAINTIEANSASAEEIQLAEETVQQNAIKDTLERFYEAARTALESSAVTETAQRALENALAHHEDMQRAVDFSSFTEAARIVMESSAITEAAQRALDDISSFSETMERAVDLAAATEAARTAIEIQAITQVMQRARDDMAAFHGTMQRAVDDALAIHDAVQRSMGFSLLSKALKDQERFFREPPPFLALSSTDNPDAPQGEDENSHGPEDHGFPPDT